MCPSRRIIQGNALPGCGKTSPRPAARPPDDEPMIVTRQTTPDAARRRAGPLRPTRKNVGLFYIRQQHRISVNHRKARKSVPDENWHASCSLQGIYPTQGDAAAPVSAAHPPPGYPFGAFPFFPCHPRTALMPRCTFPAAAMRLPITLTPPVPTGAGRPPPFPQNANAPAMMAEASLYMVCPGGLTGNFRGRPLRPPSRSRNRSSAAAIPRLRTFPS